jgi:hypothetical protein
MRTRPRRGIALSVLLGLAACGGDDETTLPDETGDLTVGEEGTMPRTLAGTRPAGPALDGTQWRWMESHCTEGPLDLAARGFEQEVRVKADAQGLVLAYDHGFARERCVQTIVQRATPGSTPDSPWAMVEEAHISVPPDCGISREQDRPGDVRMRGDFMEVYVQRSVWCNGLEVRHVYAPAQPDELTPEQIVRLYAAHFNRRDADAVAALFAETGSLVEPFTVSDTGTTRHEGRAAVEEWYREAFSVPWLAMQLTAVEGGSQNGHLVARWQYMDARIQQPFAGQNRFTIAAGEIFETQVQLTGAPPVRGTPSSGSEGGTGEGATGEGDPEAGEE